MSGGATPSVAQLPRNTGATTIVSTAPRPASAAYSALLAKYRCTGQYGACVSINLHTAAGSSKARSSFTGGRGSLIITCSFRAAHASTSGGVDAIGVDRAALCTP